MEGFITIHKKIIDWEWYTDSKTYRVFIHLLLMANYEEKKWRGLIIKRGQFVTSRNIIADSLHISEQSVRTALDKLKSTDEITVKSTNHYLLVTINKYSDYQLEPKKSTDKSTDNSTSHQPTINRQSTTTNKINKINKINNKATEVAEPFNFQEILSKMETWEKDKRMQIIGNYWKYKRFSFINRLQYETALRRELRPSQNLIGYELEKIKEVMYALNGADWIDWTLETVHKYIDRDLTKLEK